MFDFDAGKFIIVGVIALIFIPPKDLPRVLRQVGQFVGKMRRMAAEFQGQFMDAMREADMADLRREAQKLSDAARISTGLDSLHDMNAHMTSSIERPSGNDQPAGLPSASEASASGQGHHGAIDTSGEPAPAPSMSHEPEAQPPKPEAADEPIPVRQTA